MDATQFTVPSLGGVADLFSPLLRSATGIFILLMGALMEIIHGDPQGSRNLNRYHWRLPQRAINCYLMGFALLALGEILGINPPGETWKGALYLGSGRMSHAFFFLPLLILAAVPLIVLRRRVGLQVLTLLAFLLWLLAVQLPELRFTGNAFRLNYPSATLLGRPVGFSSFSLIHMAPVLVFGMAIGRAIARRPNATTGKQLALIGGLFLLLCLVMLAAAPPIPWGMSEIMTIRKAHGAVFYAFVCGSSLLTLGSFLVLDQAGVTTPRLQWIGRHSIVLFFLGNALLLLYMGITHQS